MINEEQSAIINRPIGDVFAYVTDLRHSAEWQAGLLEARQTTDGPQGIGTQFAFVRNFMGRKIEASVEFVVYEPSSIVTFRSISGPMPIESSYLFEPTPEGTKVTSKVEMQPRGFISLAEPLIAANLRREMEAGFGELKDLLENRVAKIPS
jgi:uncharacterized protein YndB with AHSA1/START domain